MRVRKSIVSILIILFIFSSVFIFKGLGMWKTESEKQPIKFTTGEFAGQNNPDDIRGSYTFGDIQNNFEITVETLARAFDVKVEHRITSYNVCYTKLLRSIY